jgi:hypothetical protein
MANLSQASEPFSEAYAHFCATSLTVFINRYADKHDGLIITSITATILVLASFAVRTS